MSVSLALVDIANMHRRFKSKYIINKVSGCWEWIACTHYRGYGQFYTPKSFSDRKMDYAHRVSYYLYNGIKPSSGQEVCHRCDNPSCVNPAHLFVGTHTDNMNDMAKKQRAGKPYTLKITQAIADSIVQLRKDGMQIKDIAVQYNISASHCSRVSRGLIKEWAVDYGNV